MSRKNILLFALAPLAAGVLAGGCLRPVNPVVPNIPPAATSTFTPTSITAGNSSTATGTPTSSPTASATPPSMNTASPTPSPTPTETPTPVPSGTPASTATPTWTSTPPPTQTPNNTPLITPTRPPTPPPSGIFWAPGQVGWTGGTQAQGNLFMAVNGAAESTDLVTLTTPSGAVTFAYVQNFNGYAYYYSNSPFAYTPGGTYTLTTVTSIGTAAATLTAPGGGVTVSPDGSAAFWDVEGNEDYINVWPVSGSFTFQSGNATSDVDSAFPIPSSAYPAAGTYNVEVAPQNATYSVTGAAAGSYFAIVQDVRMSVTR